MSLLSTRGGAIANAVASIAGVSERRPALVHAIAGQGNASETKTRGSDSGDTAKGQFPNVSVVICTYNRADMLPGALESLLRLSIPADWQWEVVLVDNRSTDTTPQVVDHMMPGREARLRYVVEQVPGVAAARNCGVARSTGDWIAFFDDDQQADPDWLRTLVDFACANKLRVVGGAVRVILPAGATDLPSEGRYLFGETPSLSEPIRYMGSLAPGAGNILVHRSVFEEVGTFDESLIEGGEDTDFFRRIRTAGIDMWFQPLVSTPGG